MEFHPSYARAVACASRALENSLTAPSGGIAAPKAPIAFVPASWPFRHGAAGDAPRLINLERRAKFARLNFATA
jgi:hypothetical protein